MSRAMLVAKREYRQLTGTRAFRISLVMVPLMFVIIGLVQAFLRPPDGSAFVILDRTDRYQKVIEHQIELNYQRQLAQELVAYARRWHVAPQSPNAPWDTNSGRVLGDPEVEGFVASGGLDAALEEIRPRLPPSAPAFKPPARQYLSVSLPSGLATDASPEAFAAAIKPYLADKVDTAVGRRSLALAVYIPEHVGEADLPIRLWTNSGGNGNDLATLVRGTVTRDLRLQAMQAFGMDASAAARIQSTEVPIVIIAPSPGAGARGVVLRSILPMAFAYLLLLTSLVSGGMMLQGLVEERSNKLLEAVLACISPDDLMRGKLLGVGAVGLTLAFAWVGCAVAGAYAIPGDLADILRPALASLRSPLMGLGLVFYFLTGYLAISMLFLAIGAVSESMQDAQGYLMPVMMLLMLPVILLINSVILNPGGILPVILSWIPLYTPFAMLARLSSGVSLLEVLGTGILLVAFVAAELLLLGRVFRATLLRTGQPPRLSAIAKLMLARDV